MAELTPPEPQSANDYADRTTAAVKSVLVEIGLILGSFQGKYAVIGGAVPWLLLDNEEMPHVGTLDVDLGLDAEALGDGEYALLVETLMRHGYDQREDLRRFQLIRHIPATDGGTPIDVVVDFLMPRDAKIVRNKPPLVDDFAVQRADGADLAMRFYQMVAVRGSMPGGRNHDGSLVDAGGDREFICPALTALVEDLRIPVWDRSLSLESDPLCSDTIFSPPTHFTNRRRLSTPVIRNTIRQVR